MPRTFKNSDLPQDLLRQMIDAEKVPPLCESDGVPCACERFLAISLTCAAHVHDWHYHEGGGKAERFQADRIFYRNLRRSDLGKVLATIYWMEVRLWGHRHFRWTSEPKPRFLRAFCESFWTRCFGW